MRLINYFAEGLRPEDRLNPKHLRLLKRYYEKQLELDRFIGSTNLDHLMRQVPRYHSGGLTS